MLKLGYKKDTLFIIPEISGIFIILIGTLIYNEFIIINRCEFNKNVGKNIALRADIEIKNNDVYDPNDKKIENVNISGLEENIPISSSFVSVDKN